MHCRHLSPVCLIARQARQTFPALFLGCLLLALGAVSATARERIAHYDSDIVVAPNGQLTVTETLQIKAENYRIKHGIYRDLPLTGGSSGQGAGRGVDRGVDRGAFRLLSATLDGASTDTSVRIRRHDIRIYIGKTGQRLSPGMHSVTLRYRTGPQIRALEGDDRLYWNVTGTRWIFPIDRIDATVHLPNGVQATAVRGFSGGFGSTNERYVSQGFTPEGAVRVRTDHILAPHEGLTISVRFPKGHMTAPRPLLRLGWFLRAHLAAIVSLAGLLGIGAVMWFLLVRVRARTRPVTPVPKNAVRSTPPQDTTPAQAQFIQQKRLIGHSALIATALDLTARGVMTLDPGDGKVWRLALTPAAAPPQPLAPEEAALTEGLRAIGGSIEVRRQNRTALRKLFRGFCDALRTSCRGRYFMPFRRLQWMGGIACYALAFVVAAIGLAGESRIFLFGPLIPLLFGVAASAIEAWVSGVQDGEGLISILGAPMMVSGLFWVCFGLASGAFGAGPLIGLIGAPVLFWIFASKIGQPTPEGYARRAEIEGLRRHLAAGGTSRRTAARLQALLPYAVALNLRQEWTDAFDRATKADDASVRPYPPTAQGFFAANLDGGTVFDACSTLSRNFSACTSASSTTGGGSGGGGFSGGGGGGGGGGGW